MIQAPNFTTHKLPFFSKHKIQSFLVGGSLKASSFGGLWAKPRKIGWRVSCKLAPNLEEATEIVGSSSKNSEFDAIVIGSGIGGLVAATQLAVKGAKVLVLEKYVIPGGSSGFYQRDGYTFDVGSSVMFGFSDKVSFFICF